MGLRPKPEEPTLPSGPDPEVYRTLPRSHPKTLIALFVPREPADATSFQKEAETIYDQPHQHQAIEDSSIHKPPVPTPE